MHKSLPVLSVLLLATACGPSSPPPAFAPAASAPPVPTFHQDVAPLLARACSGCHVEGGLAPMAFTSPGAAQQWAPAIAAATAARRMPPWLPGGSSPAMLNDPRLSDAQVALLQRWVEAGAPLGDPARAAPLPRPQAVDIGTPEVDVDLGHDYVPDTTLHDDYRCFLVDLGLGEARMATGLRITPGNRAGVHHVLVTLHPPSERSRLEALQGQDGRPGWQCFGSTVPQGAGIATTGLLGGWAPGTSALRQPDGTGVRLEAGQLVVIQVHYNLTAPGAGLPDRTRLEVALAPRGTEGRLRPTFTLPVLDRELALPPGASGHVEEVRRTGSEWTRGLLALLPDGVDVLAVSGHMHLLGTSLLLTRTRGGETTTLLDIPRWDFHWQNGYQLVQPVALRADDVLALRCVYDNTEARRQAAGFHSPLSEVRWGEGTEDEMCLAFLQVAPR